MSRAVFEWGTEVARSIGPIPFLQYSPRRRHVAELMLDAERWHARVHLVQGGRRLTFGDMQALTNRTANALRGYGVGEGDRVAVMLPPVPEAAATFLAFIEV